MENVKKEVAQKPKRTLLQAGIARQTPFVRFLYKLKLYRFQFWQGGEKVKGDSYPENSRANPYQWRCPWNLWNPLAWAYLIVASTLILVFGTLWFGMKEFPQIFKEVYDHVSAKKRHF